MKIDKHREPGATGGHRQANLVAHQTPFGESASGESAKIYCVVFSTPQINGVTEFWSSAAEAVACKYHNYIRSIF